MTFVEEDNLRLENRMPSGLQPDGSIILTDGDISLVSTKEDIEGKSWRDHQPTLILGDVEVSITIPNQTPGYNYYYMKGQAFQEVWGFADLEKFIFEKSGDRTAQRSLVRGLDAIGYEEDEKGFDERLKALYREMFRQVDVEREKRGLSERGFAEKDMISRRYEAYGEALHGLTFTIDGEGLGGIEFPEVKKFEVGEELHGTFIAKDVCYKYDDTFDGNSDFKRLVEDFLGRALSKALGHGFNSSNKRLIVKNTPDYGTTEAKFALREEILKSYKRYVVIFED